ncbi:uncharacterized protein [Dysidea avara]|uniref:uncharacterized protein isoform X3 n=1 Tax=Dysidea avara TaxID=196820 RepID=UPI0033315D77
MTVTNGGMKLGLFLLLVCVGIVFVGGLYFQSSLVEQRIKVEVEVQSEIIELKEAVYELNKQLNLLQLQINQHQSSSNDQFTNEPLNTNYTTKQHTVMKRSTSSTETTLEILRGRDGRDGRDGIPGPRGLTGPPGHKGDTGAAGPKGEGAGGVVYVRWGHNSCPSTGAQLVYSGRAGGSYRHHKGGGSNPQCLPLDPNYLKTVSGTQNNAYMYGTEYQLTNGLVANSHNTDVVCAVCYVPTRNVVYMLPAKYTCPTGWIREYYGYLMSERYNHHRSTFFCVDHSLTPVIGSNKFEDDFLIYPIEGVCGSLPCPPYDQSKELSCAVCTK